MAVLAYAPKAPTEFLDVELRSKESLYDLKV